MATAAASVDDPSHSEDSGVSDTGSSRKHLIDESESSTEPSKRTLQNRKAQREFRERKASYVKTLEDRVRRYEQSELQANVQLQRVARRLKDENDQLRQLVARLMAGEQITTMPPIGNPIPLPALSIGSSPNMMPSIPAKNYPYGQGLLPRQHQEPQGQHPQQQRLAPPSTAPNAAPASASTPTSTPFHLSPTPQLNSYDPTWIYQHAYPVSHSPTDPIHPPPMHMQPQQQLSQQQSTQQQTRTPSSNSIPSGATGSLDHIHYPDHTQHGRQR